MLVKETNDNKKNSSIFTSGIVFTELKETCATSIRFLYKGEISAN